MEIIAEGRLQTSPLAEKYVRVCFLNSLINFVRIRLAVGLVYFSFENAIVRTERRRPPKRACGLYSRSDFFAKNVSN